jgi:hypothetical protein
MVCAAHMNAANNVFRFSLKKAVKSYGPGCILIPHDEFQLDACYFDYIA